MKNKKRRFSHNLASSVIHFLETQRIPYIYDRNNGTIRFSFYLHNKKIVSLGGLRILVIVNIDNIVVYSFFPLKVNNVKVAETLKEFICSYANNGILVGNFELEDNIIRYKTFAEYAGLTPSNESIKNTIFTGIAFLDKYAEMLFEIISNDTAKEDLKKIITGIIYYDRGIDFEELMLLRSEVAAQLDKKQ